jgi:hypothetical protein
MAEKTEVKTPSPMLPATSADWQDLLERMFPSGVHTLHDLSGNAYEVRTVLSARRETELLRVLSKVAELPVGDWTQGMKTAGATPQETITGLVAVLARVTSDSRALDLLDEAFCLVFRPVVDRALAACSDLTEGLDKPSAVDVFDTVEMVQALLPFGARAAVKVMRLVQTARAKTASSPLVN